MSTGIFPVAISLLEIHCLANYVQVVTFCRTWKSEHLFVLRQVMNVYGSSV
jgi:hypothetical protein